MSAATKVVLVNPYELGRQPFGLAQPAAWLERDGFRVTCLDLALERLEPEALAGAGLVAIHLAMHTATRIAIEALPRIRALAPDAHLCAYGLYAPVNEDLLRSLGIASVLGGEVEPALVAIARRVRDGDAGDQREPVIGLDKIDFLAPAREGLPALERYAHLELPDGATRTVGFVEASRGCKHLCRHCPVVPVYEGRFRVVPVDVVVDDARRQVAAGARHLSFGDPDFLNGPTHAMRVVRALREACPGATFDATVKVEHLLRHADLLPELAESGCLFVTTAVESIDDAILERLDKGHRGEDFDRAVALTRDAGIALAPTFVAFTPWIGLAGYRDLLARLVALEVVESVPPVQLSIRLLVPRGSHLFRIEGFDAIAGDYDPDLLGHPWAHPDPRVDALQREVQAIVEAAAETDAPRRATFERVWSAAHAALGEPAPALPRRLGDPIPHMSEPWYCCAEPTSRQLAAFA